MDFPFASKDLENFNILLQILRHEVYASLGGSISADDAVLYADDLIGTTNGSVERFILANFPLFASGKLGGTISFEHELLGEYLAGKYLGWLFTRSSENALESSAIGSISRTQSLARSCWTR